MKKSVCLLGLAGILIWTSLPAQNPSLDHEWNSWYAGTHLDRLAFPLGGMGAGMICLEGTGAWSHFSIRHQPDVFNEPFCFAAIHVKGVEKGTKVLQGPVRTWKVFGQPGSGNGLRERSYGLPRFDDCRFLARFPFAEIELTDPDIPLDIRMTGWSPFTPGDADHSSLPAGAVEYRFHNPGSEVVECVFSWNTTQIIRLNGQNEIRRFDNGLLLYQAGSDARPEDEAWFGVWVDDPGTQVDHCWYRGGWFDALTMAWKNISADEPVIREPGGLNPPGASFFVPLTVGPGETVVLPLKFAWYVPVTRLTVGEPARPASAAFTGSPSKGTASGQQTVTGFRGKGLINTYDPMGDAQTGVLTSDAFTIEKDQIRLLIGGGSHASTCVNLLIDSTVALTASGMNEEELTERIWNVSKLKGRQARIQIVDRHTGGWGHINVDHIQFTDSDGRNRETFADFESDTYTGWLISEIPDPEACCEEKGGAGQTEAYYTPWYAGRFGSLEEIRSYWDLHYEELRRRSVLFRDAFYSSTLPPEVLEAVAANLTILKSPTVLRQADGRLWAWEGCSDTGGCCSGSCTHVWNYAQAISHLFPDLERSLRETEFFVSQDASGHQTFRARLPISPVAHSFHAAADGQLGGIMKVYREWRISGDSGWLKNIYPAVRQSLDYCIEAWDPEHQGVLSEPHHNTYDIEFWGPDGMCTSFYLGALKAFVAMSQALGEPCEPYQHLLERGKQFTETNLFNGAYYIQQIQWEGLRARNPLDLSPQQQATYPPEELERLMREGPKYQYGQGCLSDGVLGMWMSRVCGLEQVLDDRQVTEHLLSVHRYNLKQDLSDHANPQRPTFACGPEAGLLLCTWPRGGELSLPFVYSNEVWTGIEYQVASHLMFQGEVEKGLEIVRACRSRYDGRIRNPFNEYECGHWYARAMSSYGLIEGLTGVRYDAVDQVLYIDSRMGDSFVSFLSTETGFGRAGLRNGVPFMDVVWGSIPVDRIINRQN